MRWWLCEPGQAGNRAALSKSVRCVGGSLEPPPFYALRLSSKLIPVRDRTMLQKLQVALVVVFLLSVAARAGEFNPVLDIGDKAPEWKKLPGIDGKEYSLADLKKKEVVVLFFTCNSCPYAVDYEDRVVAFAKKHAKKDSKVALVAVNVNLIEEDLPPEMKKKAKEKSFTFPYLFDESQQIAKDYGAGFTPEFFVLNKDRKVVYMGAFDDSPNAEKVKKKYVEQAVAATLNGKMPEVKETVPIGCRIRIERRRRTRRK